jgi:hypothetical protein
MATEEFRDLELEVERRRIGMEQSVHSVVASPDQSQLLTTAITKYITTWL